MDPVRRFRWMTPAALFLAVLFLLTAGYGLAQGKIDLQAPASGPPMLRVVQIHAPAKPFAMDISIDGNAIGKNMGFRDATDFVTLTPGDHSVALNPSGTQATILSVPVTLAAGDVRTLVIYGESALPQTALVADDLTAVPDRSARLTIFNANAEAQKVTLVDLGDDVTLNVSSVPLVDTDKTPLVSGDNGSPIQQQVIGDKTLLNSIAFGSAAQPLVVSEGQKAFALVAPQTTEVRAFRDYRSDPNSEKWDVTKSQSKNVSYISAWTTVLTLRDFLAQRGTGDLVLLANERLTDGSLRSVAIPLATAVSATFGSPQSVAQLLFSRYLLPFEMVAILLLASMIGAIVVSQRQIDPIRARRMGRRKVSRPLTAVITAQTGHDVTEPAQAVKELPAEQSGPAGD
jgi:hypothetical protein